jgi:hypothetical protein
MSTRFFDLEGKEEFNRLSEREKRTQTTVHDLASSHHPVDAVVFKSAPQIWENERIHALLTFSRTSGLPVGLNEFYRLRQTGRLVREGGPLSSQGSLRVLKQRKKGNLLTESANLLTEGLAH